MNAIEIAQNPKTGAVVSTMTTTTGLGTVLDWIPSDIGKLATLVGILLSLTLIYVHLSRIRMEKRRELVEIERDRLELAVLREKEAERLERAAQRHAPLRRCDDPW